MEQRYILDVNRKRFDTLKKLLGLEGGEDKKVLNLALTVLQWVAENKRAGSAIMAVDDAEKRMVELVLDCPIFQPTNKRRDAKSMPLVLLRGGRDDDEQR